MEDPQLTSKDFSPILNRDRVIELDVSSIAAWTMCDFLLITKKEDCKDVKSSSSSDEESESDSDEEESSSLCSVGCTELCVVSTDVDG